MRVDTLAKLLVTPIDWVAVPGRPYHFAGTGAGTGCELRLNDFPEDNICTLWWGGTLHELEAFPARWRLPRHLGQ
jgi:hypothetical protein